MKKQITCSTILLGLIFVIALNACVKIPPVSPSLETGTMTDIDGNVYKTVKIGTQWWMAEDLKVRRYRDGSYILQLQNDTIGWATDTVGAYCDLKDNSQTLIGKLYNWNAVSNSKGLAPAGWHIPSDEEWKKLETYLGMSGVDADKTSWRGNNEGDKLKIASPEGWTTYGEVWSTNSSGFTALAHGCRLFNGIWGNPGLSATGFWWSATSHEGGEAWYRYLDYKKSNVFRSHAPVNYGYSIRCIKD